MKLEMAMSPMIGEAEAQRKQEIYVRYEQEQRAQAREQWLGKLSVVVKKIFLIAVVATLASFIISHRSKVIQVVKPHVILPAASVKANATTSLRESALSYEAEVDLAGK